MYPKRTINDFFDLFAEQPPRLDIKEVIYNDPATIVKWTDGDKTVVKCHEGDEYDPKLGLLYCIAKKTFGGGRYNDILAKHLPKAKVEAKTEFDWEDFRLSKLAVQCRTESDADDFLKKCAERGYKWSNSAPANHHTNWSKEDKGGTCYRYNSFGSGLLSFGDREFYENTRNVPVVVWKGDVEAKTETKLDRDRFSKGEVVVNCKTREAADDFLKKCEKRGFNWAGKPATDHNNWGFHGDKTCYRYFDGHLAFCYRSHHEFYGREVFEWEPKAPKFDWEGFKNKEFVVECKTVKAAKKFNRKCEKHGIDPFSETVAKYVFHRSEKFMICKDGDNCGLYRGPFVDENLPVKEYK